VRLPHNRVVPTALKDSSMASSGRELKKPPGSQDAESVNSSPSLRYKYKAAFDSPDSYITFYSKSADEYSRTLSNFFVSPVCIDYTALSGKGGCICTYPTGEHAFHGGKFKLLGLQLVETDPRQEVLLSYSLLFEGESVTTCALPTPKEAKRAGGHAGLQLTLEELARWEQCSMKLQEQICREKLKDAVTRKFLEGTRDRYLVHYEAGVNWPCYGATILTPEDSPFGDGRSWMKGDNLLGEVWMKLREEISDSKESRRA
jgi:predicted NAD-dependent protein-ADP-ribosyltransferase YbiA (DUF1768 family)